jgi:ribonuclease VapC
LNHLRFSRRRHPARLNPGDWFAYALARERNARLLFKGRDFALPDIALATP